MEEILFCNGLYLLQGFMYLLIYTVIQDKLELAMLTMKLLSEMSIAAQRFQVRAKMRSWK